MHPLEWWLLHNLEPPTASGQTIGSKPLLADVSRDFNKTHREVKGNSWAQQALWSATTNPVSPQQTGPAFCSAEHPGGRRGYRQTTPPPMLSAGSFPINGLKHIFSSWMDTSLLGRSFQRAFSSLFLRGRQLTHHSHLGRNDHRTSPVYNPDPSSKGKQTHPPRWGSAAQLGVRWHCHGWQETNPDPGCRPSAFLR